MTYGDTSERGKGKDTGNSKARFRWKGGLDSGVAPANDRTTCGHTNKKTDIYVKHPSFQNKTTVTRNTGSMIQQKNAFSLNTCIYVYTYAKKAGEKKKSWWERGGGRNDNPGIQVPFMFEEIRLPSRSTVFFTAGYPTGGKKFKPTCWK